MTRRGFAVAGRGLSAGDPPELRASPEEKRAQEVYRHPGLSPLAVAGAPPGEISYLDALAI